MSCITHLAKDDVSWETMCGQDLTGRGDAAISHNPEHVTCETCVPPKTSTHTPVPTRTKWPKEDGIPRYSDFLAFPLQLYEDEGFDKAIYPGKGTGNSVALSYTLAGRISELGEYVEKFYPVAVDSRVHLGSRTPEQANLEHFLDILRMMMAVGKRAGHFKKPLRRGETKLPAFRPLTPEEKEALDDEDGDSYWYQWQHTSERAGERSIGDIIWQNILKLCGRKKCGSIEGDGDKR